MKVRIQKLVESAVIPFKTYDKDFGFDVTATSEQEVAPNVWKYGIGIAFQIDRFSAEELNLYSDTLLSIDLRSRSSVWKTGMVLSNCVGTIDELYTGEVSAVFYHVMPNMPRYRVGDRIGQIKLGLAFQIEFEEAEELSETERGSNGYGHTGR